MKQKYEKPRQQDLNDFLMAVGGCVSGITVINICAKGANDAGRCGGGGTNNPAACGAGALAATCTQGNLANIG